MPLSQPSDSPARHAAFVVFWNGRSHVLPINRWALIVSAIVIPAFSALLVISTAYLIFHDELLASLMTHQTEMQYSYEDRIAALGTQLDQQTISGNAERGTIDTRLRRLDEKREQLENRAAALDGLIARIRPGAGKPFTQEPDTDGLVEHMSSGGSRIGHDRTVDRQHVDLSSDNATAAHVLSLERTWDSLDQRQTAVLADLGGPTMRDVAQMRIALAKSGLPLARWHLDRDVGGPFVPLSHETIGFDETIKLLGDAARQHERLGAIVDRVPLRQPLAGPLEVTSTFGARLDPFFGRPAMHTGVDLHEAWGESVVATAAGVVSLAGSDGGYGKMVEIDHGNGIRTRYAHLGGIAVTINQKVAAGTIVGQVGATGRATGPHLHYEVRIDGEPVDPARFLAAGAELFPG